VTTHIRNAGTASSERSSVASRDSMPKPKKKLTATPMIRTPDTSGRIISSLSCISTRYDCPTSAKLLAMRSIGAPVPGL
jgi:hypothetical protein